MTHTYGRGVTHIYGIGVTHTCFEAFSVSQFVRFAFNSNQPLKTFTNIHGHYMGIHVKPELVIRIFDIKFMIIRD